MTDGLSRQMFADLAKAWLGQDGGVRRLTGARSPHHLPFKADDDVAHLHAGE
jgi:hypothetical protein